MENTEFPDRCFFRQIWKMDIDCPYDAINDDDVARIYGFVGRVMEEFEVADETDMQKKRKKKRYSMSIEKFTHWANLFMIPEEDRLEASIWCSVALKAANEAQDMAVIEERRRRWKTQ